jgi:15-cis-phytoene synthase
MTGAEQARRVLAAGSKSFALAGKLFPRACRDDAAIVYAFCRRADDLVDQAQPGAAGQAVEQLQRDLASIFAGRAQTDPVLAAFQEVVVRRRIPAAYPGELIAGFAMDARAPVVYQSWQELRLYCFRVAGTVGLMMCHVMGIADERRLANAAALGMAMQLTNIARDVAEDWRLGRLYVPREALVGPIGSDPGRPLDQPTAAVLSRTLPALLAEAQALYRAGDAGLDALSLRCAIAVRAARLIYAAIGDGVAARDHDVTAPRAVVSRPRKLWLVLRAAAGILARRVLRRPSRLAVPKRTLTLHEIALG